jgi:hypothetical protein
MSTTQYFNGEFKSESISVPGGDVSDIEIIDIDSLTPGEEHILNNNVGLFASQAATLTKTYVNADVTTRDSHINTSGSLIKTERGINPLNEYRMTSLTGALTGCTSINVTGDGSKFTYYDGYMTIPVFHGTTNLAIGFIIKINDYMTTNMITGPITMTLDLTGHYVISCVGSVLTYIFTGTNPFPLGIEVNMCFVFTGTSFVLLMNGLAPVGVYSGSSEATFPSSDPVLHTFDGYIKNFLVSNTSENIGLYYPLVTTYSELHPLDNYLLFPLNETTAVSIPSVVDTEGDTYDVIKVEPISLTAMWGAGKIGNCLTIQNVACPAMYIDPQPISMTSEFSIEVWLNVNVSSSAFNVIYRADCYQIRFTGSKYTFSLGDKTFTTTSTYNDGAWHQIVLCYDGSAYGYVYMDGELLMSQSVFLQQISGALDFITETMALSGGKMVKIDNIIYSRKMYSEIDVLRRYGIVTSSPLLTGNVSQCALTNDLGSTYNAMNCVVSNPGTLTYTTNGLDMSQYIIYNSTAILGTIPTSIEFIMYFTTINTYNNKIFSKGHSYYMSMEQGELQFHIGSNYYIRYEYYLMPATSYLTVYTISNSGYQLFINGSLVPVRAVIGTYPGVIQETVGSLSFGPITSGYIKKIYEYSSQVDQNYISRKNLGLSEYYATSTNIERFHVSSTTIDTLYSDKGTGKIISIPSGVTFENGPQGRVLKISDLPSTSLISNIQSEYLTTTFGIWICFGSNSNFVLYMDGYTSQFFYEIGTNFSPGNIYMSLAYVGIDNKRYIYNYTTSFHGANRYVLIQFNISALYINGIKHIITPSLDSTITKTGLGNYKLSYGAGGDFMVSDIFYYPRIITDSEALLEYNTGKFTSDLNYSPIRNMTELITTYNTAVVRLHLDETTYGANSMYLMSENCRNWIKISTVIDETTTGHFGKGVRLTNTNATAVSFVPLTTEFSMGVWIYFENRHEEGTMLRIILDDGTGGGDPEFSWTYINYEDTVNSGKLYVTRTNMNSVVPLVPGDISYEVGSAEYQIVKQRGWHFLVFTYNKLYLDGVLQSETTSSWSTDLYTITTAAYIGMLNTSTYQTIIDEFYYYPYDILQAEVTYEYGRALQTDNYTIAPTINATVGSNWNSTNSNITNGTYCNTNYLGSKTTVSNYTYLPFNVGFSIEFISNAIGYIVKKMQYDGTNGYYIKVSATNIVLYYRNGTVQYIGTYTADVRNKHIVITCPTGGFATSGNVKLYVDSVLTALTSEVITVVTSGTTANVYPMFGNKTVGTITSILYYDFILTQTQVNYRYLDLYDDRYSTGIYYNMNIDSFDRRMFNNIQSMAITRTIPANTNIKFLMVLDSGIYYKFLSGSWVISTSDTSNGNTYSELEAITVTQWANLIALPSATIGIRIGLYTSDSLATPIFTNLVITYKIYKQLPTTSVPMYYVSNYGYMTIVKNETIGTLNDLKIFTTTKTK